VFDNLWGNVSNHRKTLALYRAKDAAFPPAHHVPGRFQPCPNIEQTENEVNSQVLPQEHWPGAGLTANRVGAAVPGTAISNVLAGFDQIAIKNWCT
jgi:hypothetical protein